MFNSLYSIILQKASIQTLLRLRLVSRKLNVLTQRVDKTVYIDAFYKGLGSVSTRVDELPLIRKALPKCSLVLNLKGREQPFHTRQHDNDSKIFFYVDHFYRVSVKSFAQRLFFQALDHAETLSIQLHYELLHLELGELKASRLSNKIQDFYLQSARGQGESIAIDDQVLAQIELLLSICRGYVEIDRVWVSQDQISPVIRLLKAKKLIINQLVSDNQQLCSSVFNSWNLPGNAVLQLRAPCAQLATNSPKLIFEKYFIEGNIQNLLAKTNVSINSEEINELKQLLDMQKTNVYEIQMSDSICKLSGLKDECESIVDECLNEFPDVRKLSFTYFESQKLRGTTSSKTLSRLSTKLSRKKVQMKAKTFPRLREEILNQICWIK
ncbi:hypothetical protein P9112_003414 [Eukaryota sp. TZLM1-RC]